jgi:hypothetical protein
MVATPGTRPIREILIRTVPDALAPLPAEVGETKPAPVQKWNTGDSFVCEPGDVEAAAI